MAGEDGTAEDVVEAFDTSAPNYRSLALSYPLRLAQYTPYELTVACLAFFNRAPEDRTGSPRPDDEYVEQAHGHLHPESDGMVADCDVDRCREAFMIINTPTARRMWILSEGHFVRFRGELDLAMGRDTDEARQALRMRSDDPEPARYGLPDT